LDSHRSGISHPLPAKRNIRKLSREFVKKEKNRLLIKNHFVPIVISDLPKRSIAVPSNIYWLHSKRDQLLQDASTIEKSCKMLRAREPKKKSKALSPAISRNFVETPLACISPECLVCKCKCHQLNAHASHEPYLCMMKCLGRDHNVGNAASWCSDIAVFTSEISWWRVVADGEVWRDARASIGQAIGAVLSGTTDAGG